MKNTKELVLAKIKETLLQVAPGAKVILFGSRARNDARSDSDWDILILVDKTNWTQTISTVSLILCTN